LPSYRTQELGIFISMTRRGFVLVFSMVAALLIAIVCMALVSMVTGEAQRARFQQQRGQALYASEAGVVWAQGELQRDSCWADAGAQG
jgi:Tfp pilus assembly protein PilX